MNGSAAGSPVNSRMENIDGLIFDFGGTLDSRGEHWYHVMARAYDEEGVTLSREAYIHGERNITPLVTKDDTMLDLLRKKVELQSCFSGIKIDPGQIALRCYNYARECIEELRPVLTRLSERYPLAIVSNFYGNLEAVLRDYGIRDLFVEVVDSGIAGVRKPDPAIFRVGAEGLAMGPERILVIGDSVDKDILPAASIGCRTALVEGRPWDDSREQPPVPEGTIRVSSLREFLKSL